MWRAGRDLLGEGGGGNVLGMFKVGRFLQLVALIILPLAMLSNLSGSITLGMMLRFLFVGIVLFTIGWMLQRYSGGVG
jgi:hypothetical protein